MSTESVDTAYDSTPEVVENVQLLELIPVGEIRIVSELNVYECRAYISVEVENETQQTFNVKVVGSHVDNEKVSIKIQILVRGRWINVDKAELKEPVCTEVKKLALQRYKKSLSDNAYSQIA